VTEGERWTQEVLAELRADRYRPRAWLRFLARSFVFARQRRGERRLEHRETLLLGALGLAGWLGVGLAGRPVLAAAGCAWWLLATAMLDWHLGMLELPDGTRHEGLGIPNLLTQLRGGTPPALAALFGTPAGTIVLALAGASDVLDGWLARRRGETTRLGRWLDGSVDGLVLGAAALGAHAAGRAPGWLLALVLARFGLPWLLVGVLTFRSAATPPAERLVPGRIPGLALFAGLSLLAFDAGGGVLVTALGAAGGLGTFALTIVSRRTGVRRAASKVPASGL
jgi:cardiolipin synthase